MTRDMRRKPKRSHLKPALIFSPRRATVCSLLLVTIFPTLCR